MTKIIEQVKDIFLSPATFWENAQSEQTSEIDIVKNFYAPVAAIPTVSGFLGSLFIGENFFAALFWAILFFGCAIAGVFLFSKAILFLTTSFNAEKNETAFFKLAAYSYTPFMLAGIFFIIPPLYWLLIIGIYGFYFFWIGFQKIVKCPEVEMLSFTFIGSIIWVIIILLIFLLPALISGTSVYYRII